MQNILVLLLKHLYHPWFLIKSDQFLLWFFLGTSKNSYIINEETIKIFKPTCPFLSAFHTQRHITKASPMQVAHCRSMRHEYSRVPHLLFFLIDLYWSIIASQYCVSFCCTTKWISHMHTHVPITPTCNFFFSEVHTIFKTSTLFL